MKEPGESNLLFEALRMDLLKRGLDAEITILYLYRVAADHYVLNPTSIHVQDRNIQNISGKIANIEIRNRSLIEKVLETAKETVKNN